MAMQVLHWDVWEKIFSLDSNTYVVYSYVVYSLWTINTNHVCPKAKTISAVQIKAGQDIKLNPGCYIRTIYHVIRADETEDVEVHSKWLDWTWNLGKLFQQPENKAVTAAIEKLQTQISRKFDSDILLKELNTLTKEVTTEHWTFASLGVMVARAMIIFFIGLCCWTKCCQGDPTPAYPAPSPPPAPLVFNMAHDPICR
jgi:hypothetical protein